ncbi:carboxy terminal-processing peptidase [Lacinutrix sp. C3R15]|uniref:carboxy terminal-processing peptidase n=1 Tax=Flavobacteriaceae TaxID=49546 RepID=UPI001C0863A4|nr:MULTISPECIES: carboxy terminal-processing peptidase [Flavobacteriaceae]MBU2940128.1 carboxy terminal-processing peptidase [Lacinutrix sp. C3R15]MDO6623445.1 carboxy terminal-processing peptidase [Oceanihabitans sp. 1_MG-2023]
MIKNLLYPFLLCIPLLTNAQDNVFCNQLTTIDSLIKVAHYKPKATNDSLSKHVFNLFLKQLDADKRYYTKKDIATFKIDQFQIDDYIKNKNCSFITKYIQVLTQRIEQSIQYLENLKKQNLDYSGKDILNFSQDENAGFYKNHEESQKYWSKKVRYLLVIEALEQDSILENAKANFKTFESLNKEKVIDNQICLLYEILNQDGGITNFVTENFLNAFIQYQDPNSTYFNETEKTVFENSLAIQQETFGIITKKTKNGEIVISHIIPGSSAFKNGSFEKDDVIKSLTSKVSNLQIHCTKNEDVIRFLNNSDNKTVTFKIKKNTGSILDIEISKTALKVEENSITGYIIGEDTTFGYIKIPSFYTNLESYNKRGLTADFAKELYKLQKENIKGLIIDLRFNGGGSMQEAIELSGMFINKGPVSIIRDNKNERFTFRDPSRGTFFNKPIVILINNYSASASEFFASTMQDYNRAILIGSTTHGKSSAQVILPLSEKNNLGFSKITTEVFYRVTGKSLQSNGVTPDIALPSIYDGFKFNEIDKPYALNNDTIQATLKHIPLPKINFTNLITKSKARVNNSADFALVKTANKKLLENYYNEISFALTLDNIYKHQQEYKTMWQSIFGNNKTRPKITVTNTLSTNEVLSYNENEKTNNQKLLGSLSKDIYIHEASLILTNFINSNH